MKTLLTVCILFLALGCGTVQPEPTPAYDCSTVCQHGQELGCPWAQWTPMSNCLTSCAEWRDTFFYDMQCMSTAATCATAAKCNEVQAHR